MLYRRLMTSSIVLPQNKSRSARFCFANYILDLPSCYRYLQGIERSHTLLQYETGRCKSERSSPCLCHVCRSMQPNTEQKAPKKLKENSQTMNSHIQLAVFFNPCLKTQTPYLSVHISDTLWRDPLMTEELKMRIQLHLLGAPTAGLGSGM